MYFILQTLSLRTKYILMMKVAGKCCEWILAYVHKYIHLRSQKLPSGLAAIKRSSGVCAYIVVGSTVKFVTWVVERFVAMTVVKPVVIVLELIVSTNALSFLSEKSES